MAMHIDLILKPWTRDNADGKLFLWMDNCGPHKTDCLHSVFNEANVEVGLLPPNMTSELQVLDLVVNGPIKAHIRKLRAQRICKYFDKYRGIFRDQRKLKATQLPKWEPPKPSLEECIQDMLNLLLTDFATHKFKESICSSFTSTGTSYSPGPTFADYFPHNSNGTIIIDESKLDYTKLELDEDDIVDIIVSDGNDEEFEDDDEEYDEED